MDAGGLGLRRALPMHRLAIELDLAAVRGLDTGDDLGQRRFPGTVLADERVDLSRADLEIDPGERLHAGEGFLNAGNR